MADIVARLMSACNGHPYAKIAWPHRILHESADEIIALRTRAEEAEKRCEELEAALKPFATAGQIIDGPFGPALFAEDDMAFQSGCAWSENGVRKTITWGDFRRARAALSSKEQG